MLLKTDQVRVCRRWRDVGEQPGLWTWVVISVHLGNLARFLNLLIVLSIGANMFFAVFYLILYLSIIELFCKGTCCA